MKIFKLKHNLIRHHLGVKLSIKYTPQLQFIHDNSMEYAEKIDNLIQKIHKND